MTIYDIAKKANVSTATVSRAINPLTRGKVAPKTLSRLDLLIKKFDYTPSLAAKNLGGASLKTIGVVLPHFEGIFFSDYYAKVLAAVADALLESDYHFKLLMMKPGAAKWDKYDFKSGEGVGALIVTHWPYFFSTSSVLEKLKLPCLVINDPEAGVRARFVAADNEMGGRLAAETLYAKGHRRIAVLAGPSWSSDSLLRLKGFKNALEKVGDRATFTVVTADFQEDRAALAAEEILARRDGTTAFFCLNDLMAFGVLKVLKKFKLRCPEDVSVIGYDDDQRGRYSEPPLTSVRVPLYELVKKGTEDLLFYLKSGRKRSSVENRALFPVELVDRGSVGECRKK